MRVRKDIWDKTVGHSRYECPVCRGLMRHLEGEDRMAPDFIFLIGCDYCGFAFEEKGDDTNRKRLVRRISMGADHEDA